MRGKAGVFPGNRPCAAPGCAAAGEYRAPRQRPRDNPPATATLRWQYFCLDHVREFNARWNYFEGLSAEAIHAAQSPLSGWDDRATRTFATNGAVWTAADLAGAGVDDPLEILRRKGARPQRRPALAAADRRALAKLGLGEEATLADVKASYRRLARRYHPDANHGDRRHEARFRALTEAYDQLRHSSSFARCR